MVSIIVSLDLCLTTTLIQDVLVDVFLAVLDRDDKAELSESLKISLNTNIQSWRSTGCVRGMVVPITTAIRRCRKEATGENMIPQLNQCEKQEVVELLVWLFSSDLKRFQAISATCYSLVAGWKAAGICVDLGTLETSIKFKPTVYYTHGVGEDNTSTEILEAAEDLFPSQRVIAPQRCLFRFGYPEDMIECLRIPIPVRNDISMWWHIGKEAAEGCNISFETTETDIIYRISHHTKYSRRWPPSTVRLSKTWFIAPDDRICQAIEDLTGRNSEPFAHWISMYMAEGNTDTAEALLEDIHISIPNEELDGMLRFQGLVYGFWYQLLGQLLLSDHLQEDIMLSGIWGRRSASLLVRFFELARENGEGGIERTYLMRTLRRMFLGEKAPFLGDENLHNDANLVGIIGSISLLCYSLLRLPETPQDCARFYLVSLPIVELFGNQHGELLSSMRSGGVDTYNAETRTLDSTLLRIHPKRAWSVHPKLKFINGRVENVSMVARCGGIPVLQFPSHMADHLFLGMELHSYLGCSNSSQVSDGQSKSVRVSRVLCGNEITEEDFLKGSIPQPCVMLHDSGMENKWMTLVHSSGSLAMRYAGDWAS